MGMGIYFPENCDSRQSEYILNAGASDERVFITDLKVHKGKYGYLPPGEYVLQGFLDACDEITSDTTMIMISLDWDYFPKSPDF
jgi:hypothetical protein